MAFASSAHSHTPFAPLKRLLDEAKNVSDLSSLLPSALPSFPFRLAWCHSQVEVAGGCELSSEPQPDLGEGQGHASDSGLLLADSRRSTHICVRAAAFLGLQLPSLASRRQHNHPPQSLLASWPPLLKCASASRTKGKKPRRTPRRRRQPRSTLHEQPPPPISALAPLAIFPLSELAVHWISIFPLVNSAAPCSCAPAPVPERVTLQEASQARQGDNRLPHGQPRRPSPSLQRLPPHQVQRFHPHNPQPTTHNPLSSSSRWTHHGNLKAKFGLGDGEGFRGGCSWECLEILPFQRAGDAVVCPNGQAKWLTKSVSIRLSQGGDTRGTTCTC
jgi:hypothetical protein